VDQGGNTCRRPLTCRELFEDIAAGFKLSPPSSVAESLGYSDPGALLLPVSVRAPHTVYQSVGFIAYPEQLVDTKYNRVRSREESIPAAPPLVVADTSSSYDSSSDSEDKAPEPLLSM